MNRFRRSGSAACDAPRRPPGIQRRELRLRHAVQSDTRDTAVLDTALAGRAEEDMVEAAADDARSGLSTLLPRFVLQCRFGDPSHQGTELGIREADTR
jgi:hypothetical protein